MLTRATQRGLRLTELGLGGAQLGNLYRAISDEQAVATVEAAWGRGIRYFDTAPHYGLGLSERRLGEALRSHPRDEYVVSSKVGRLIVDSPETAHERDDEGFDVPADRRRVFDFSRDGVLRSIDDTLRRTGLDRIDVAYLHDAESHFEQASGEGIRALIEMRDQGVVTAVGAGMNFAEPLAELIRRADVDVVMVAGRFSLLDPTALDDLLPTALEHGVGVVAAGVYNSGLLGRPRPKPDAHYNYEPAPPELIARANRLADVCEAHGVTLPVAAVAYPLLHPAVVSISVGSQSPEQVDGNVDRYETPVPDDLWSDLRSAGLLPTTTESTR